MEVVFMSIVVALIVLSIMRIYFSKGPLNWPLVGMVPWLVWHFGNIYEDGCKMVLEHGGTFIVKGPWFLRSNLFQVVTFSPDNVEYILKGKFSSFPKGPYFREVFFHLFGNGIFTADDELWKRQRKPTALVLGSGEFRDRNFKVLQEALQQKLLPFLEEVREKETSIDLQHVLLDFAMDNFFMVVLGREGDGRALAEAFDDATERCCYRFVCPSFVWKTMRFFNVGFEKRLREAEATVQDIVSGMVKRRLQEVEEGDELAGDILSNVIKLERDQGRTLPQDLLEGWTTSMVLALKDNIALAMSWFFWLISTHPYVEEKIICELSDILSSKKMRKGDDTMDVFGREELKRMNYLHATLSEVIRLCPPTPAVYREATIDCTLPDGTLIKKGTKCLVFIYATNRMESIWGNDAHEFKPERWISKEGVYMNQSDYKFPVFTGGPRICLGKDLAYVNMKCMVANILAHYQFKVKADHQVKPKLGMNLFMKHGLKVTVHARNDILSRK